MLLEQLRELGAALPVSETPTTADLPLIVSGLIRYAETGSLEPPKVETVSPQTVAVETAEQARIAELESQVTERERQLNAQAAGPAEVLPTPPTPAADEAKSAIDTVAQGPGPTREELQAQLDALPPEAPAETAPTAPAESVS